MKSIITFSGLLLSCLCIMISCKEQTAYIVAEKSGEQSYKVSDSTKALNYFYRILENAKLKASLTNFYASKELDSATGDPFYMLKAQNANGSLCIALEVFPVEGNKLGITSESLNRAVMVCKVNCDNGVAVYKINGGWRSKSNCPDQQLISIQTIAKEENNYTTPIQAFIERY